jgi:FHS family glucose/mannose:H+ symporter-like MFS transporter
MSDPHGRQNKRFFILLFFAFIVYGSSFTIFGAVLPRIIADFNWSYTMTGLVFMVGSVGFFVSAFLSGLVVERHNAKPFLIAALCLCAIALSLFARIPSPTVNLLLNLVIGFSQGVIEVIINYEVIRLEKVGQSRLMNLLHAGFSIGAIIGPLGVSAILQYGRVWNIIFPFMGALFLILAGLYMFTPFFGPEPHTVSGKSGSLSLLRTPMFIMLCLSMLFLVGSEMGATIWMAEYFVRILVVPASIAAFSISALWIGVLVGRTLISVLLHKKRQEMLVLILALLCVGSLISILFIRSTLPAMVIVFILGLGFSGIYPLIMSLTGMIFHSSTAVGMLMTFTGIGSFTFPFLLAGVAERLGLRSGFLLLATLPLGIAIISVILSTRYRAK